MKSNIGGAFIPMTKVVGVLHRRLFKELARMYIDRGSWEVIASMACSQLCPSEILHKIGTVYGRQTGLGYILRIVGRNPNVQRSTLESIANDSTLDKHYRIVAQLHLTDGLEHATKRAS